MKLLAKTPEERYQTAGGVEHDLRRCLASWEARTPIDAFPLGEHDTPDRLGHSGKALRALERGRGLARRLRARGQQRQSRAGAHNGLFGHRQVVGGQRAAPGAGAGARTVRLGQVRPVPARHSLCDAGAGLPGPGPAAAREERGGAGGMARGAAAGAGIERTARRGPGARSQAHHRRAGAGDRAAAAGCATPLPARAPALHRRVCAARASARAVPRRSAMARCGHSGSDRRPDDPARCWAPAADRSLPGQRSRGLASAAAQARCDPSSASGSAGDQPRAARPRRCGAADRRCAALRASARHAARAAGAREDRWQSVLRHPVPVRAGGERRALLRPCQRAMVMGPGAHSRTGLHRQRGGAHRRQAGSPGGANAGGAAAARLPWQQRRAHPA